MYCCTSIEYILLLIVHIFCNVMEQVRIERVHFFRKNNYHLFTLLALLVLTLTACGAASGENNTPSATSTEVAATASPAPTSPSQTDEVPAELVEDTRAALAAHLEVEESALTLARAEARDWADSALGCPAEGQMYLQVITPGYLLEFRDTPGQTYPVHTNESGEQLILCQDEQPVQLSGADDSDAELPVDDTPVPASRSTVTPVSEAEEAPVIDDVPPAILDSARQALADHLAVAPEDLTLTGAEARDWSDSSLGCPEPGTPYLQVITPGYLLEFSDAQGQTYAIHTSDTGEPLILCENEQPLMLPLP